MMNFIDMKHESSDSNFAEDENSQPVYMITTSTQTLPFPTRKIKPVKHPGLVLKTPIAYQSNTDPSVIPIQKDGIGKTIVNSTFPSGQLIESNCYSRLREMRGDRGEARLLHAGKTVLQHGLCKGLQRPYTRTVAAIESEHARHQTTLRQVSFHTENGGRLHRCW